MQLTPHDASGTDRKVSEEQGAPHPPPPPRSSAHEQRHGSEAFHRDRHVLSPSPSPSPPPVAVHTNTERTAMWLEQHTEQMLVSPGFVRMPLIATGQHLRSGSFGGSGSRGNGHGRSQSHSALPSHASHSYQSYHSHTRQSSPSQWSTSQYSQSQCVTPRGSHGLSHSASILGGAGQSHPSQSRGGLPLPLRADHPYGPSSAVPHMGTVTPPTLQITSPVTPRDYSSSYNSPRASEDMQRYTSDEFPFRRSSLDGMSGGVSGVSGMSGRLSPYSVTGTGDREREREQQHRGRERERSGGLSMSLLTATKGDGMDDQRSSFKSLVSYLDTKQNSTPRSCSSFNEEEGEDEEDEMDQLAWQVKEKVTLFPGSFTDSLLLNSLQTETTPFKEMSLQMAGAGRRTSSELNVAVLAQETATAEDGPVQNEHRTNQTSQKNQQLDVFSFPVDTLPPKARGLLGGANKGSWPNFQSGPAEHNHVDTSDDEVDGKVDGKVVSHPTKEEEEDDEEDDNESETKQWGTTTHDTSTATSPRQAQPPSPHRHQPTTGMDGSETSERATNNSEDVFEELTLRIIHRKNTTGFEFQRELPLHVGNEIAGRFRIVELLGQAAFSRAVQAIDLTTGQHVCLKVVKNSKDYFDQSLDEIRLLRLVNERDPRDEHGIVRLYDYFYYAEHLILVTELLRANLYEFSRHDPTYFTPPRLKKVATQLLSSVAYMHRLSLIHADLKPENILMKSYAACQIKLIDLGSSFFNHDRRASYVVQSRSYRAPEVILGCDYDYKIDIWSIGCILVELAVGDVLFNDCSGAQMLARMESVLGGMPAWMRATGRYAKRYFLADGRLFEQSNESKNNRAVDVLLPQSSSLNYVLDGFDKDMADFISLLLALDPNERLGAEDALQHPYLAMGDDGDDDALISRS